MINELMIKLGEFKKWREAVHSLLAGMRPVTSSVTGESIGVIKWYNSLLALPVSKRSNFGDPIWDFNDDAPNAARNVQGSKLKINFEKYPLLNYLAVFEVKLAMYFYLKIPSALKTVNAQAKVVKPNTAIPIFKAGMSFLSTMSEQARFLLTDEFFESDHHGLSYFDSGMYRDAAPIYPYTYGAELRRFFGIIRSPFLQEHVFGQPLPHVELHTLAWAKVAPEPFERKRANRILPNDVFEKASREASIAVVGFLDALGEPVQDLVALTKRTSKIHLMAQTYDLSRYNLNLYVALRLRRKGYDFQTMEAALDDAWPEFYSERFANRFKSPINLLPLTDSPMDDDFRLYINFISYSACYLVAQYTGMRPSELAEILVDSCLEEQNDYWLIISNVIKHRQGLSKLFDDKWIAIPIVRDAIRAAHFIAKIKQNPYLFSNMDTVDQGARPTSMPSPGISHQFKSFFMEVLTDEEFESLDFSAYSLRHTLAYQMARAELGLPFISHQLKHFGDLIGGAGQNKAFSEVSLGYGAVADILSSGGRSSGRSPRELADEEYVKNFCDPDGSYAGPRAESHKARLKKVFAGYMAAGYTKEETFLQMVKKRLAVINIGQGFCYGGLREDFDESLPCIGSLRCNPIRCTNAVVTKANAPKWREVYVQNQLALDLPAFAQRKEELRAAMAEAEAVLKHLGEEVEV